MTTGVDRQGVTPPPVKPKRRKCRHCGRLVTEYGYAADYFPRGKFVCVGCERQLERNWRIGR